MTVLRDAVLEQAGVAGVQAGEARRPADVKVGDLLQARMADAL